MKMIDFCKSCFRMVKRNYSEYRFIKIQAKNGVQIREGCSFQCKETIRFGNGVFVNKDCKFYNGYGEENARIELEDNVSVGFNCTFITTSHEIGESSKRVDYKVFFAKPIIVKKGTWIAANVTVLPGVTIGEGCVIAAGSVVLHDCEAGGLYAGVPAKRIKTLP